MLIPNNKTVVTKVIAVRVCCCSYVELQRAAPALSKNSC